MTARETLQQQAPNSRRADVIATELGYLWSNLLQRGVLDSHRSIGFCAIGDDEGSNTLAANLALFLGSKDKRLALVEASLRRQALAAVFQVTPVPGLADLLAAKAVQRDVLRLQVAPGVDLMPAGQSTDPFWSFTDDRFRAILGQLLVERDLCLVDVPSLNRAPEASLVVRALDAVVLVVEANRHRAEVVQRNLTYLRSLGTPVLGSIVNELVHEVPTLVQKLL
ncbi:MAG: CpsD/CapB family tyrosine-protein kinase [Planctomycetes bacterium]|nr:CpsD/CapB family tyrosine-protein kinase [Planctomycetota bacterium]